MNVVYTSPQFYGWSFPSSQITTDNVNNNSVWEDVVIA